MGQGLSKRRTVLIVEDDLDLRHLTTTLLEDEQLETIELPLEHGQFRTDAINALACRIRTGKSGPPEPPNWICVTISPEVGASPAAETLRVRAAWRLRAGIHNRVRAMGIRDRPISPRSPWQNPVAERLIGTRTAFARGSE